jgi:hypothetical protein
MKLTTLDKALTDKRLLGLGGPSGCSASVARRG